MSSFQSLIINICRLLIIIQTGVLSNFILPEYEHCNAPLGMESGSITDSDLTSSSTHDVSSVGPQMARIRTELEGGAWCPDRPIGINSYEYLQVEFRQVFFVNAIETQGRFGNGQGKEYAEFYQIQYQRDNQSTEWITYRNSLTNKTILQGNVNTYLPEKRSLISPILAKRLRIIPFSSRWRTVCMRVEFYGCPHYAGITSYTTSPTIDKDTTYDGGIGKLVDGIFGDDESTRLSWNKSPVSLVFHFDVVREFKVIQIYTMREKYRSITVKFDDHRSIEHEISLMKSLSSNVFIDTIDLSKYENILIVGKRVEILVHFHHELLLLTEVSFSNEPALFNHITSTVNNTTNCSFVINTNSTSESTFLLNIYSLEWLTISIGCLLCLSLIILLIVGFYRFRSRSHRRLRQNSSLYYKSSQMTATTSGSCASTSSEHDGSTLPVKHLHTHLLLSNNYDDLNSEQQSMGSYIYPITSTTSLLQTSSPSSIFKGEQYAVIDGNYSFNTYKQWPTNNTFHYASSDIGRVDSIVYHPQISLFNCILPRENSSSSQCCHHSPINYPPNVDETQLVALKKISETTNGEIYFGKYLLEQQSKCVLIKIIKTNSIESSRTTFLNELSLLSRLNHVNLSSIYAVQLDLLYLVQEHSQIGTLQDYFRTITNQSSNDSTFQKMNIYFAYQLANALQYLTQWNFLHCDIGTRNCLVFSDYTIKLTDCAMSLAQYEQEYWSTTNGQRIPLRWIAPEVLLTKNPTLKSDVYSYAITLWEIWSRCTSLPYALLTNDELYQRILLRKLENKTDLGFLVDCPKEIYDLLCECWHIDGLKRPFISDIALYFRRHLDATRQNSIS